MKTNIVRVMAVAGLVVLSACGNSTDEALRQQLMLAARAYPYQPYMTPLEQGYGYAAVNQPRPYSNGGYVAPTTRSTPVVRREPVYTSTSTTTRAPATRVVKNTKRDAIIGAAAGAAIGAVVSGDRVKGAVIGAAAGGIIGAVIGNNVDKKRVPIP
jgi:hypothetical protein